MSTKGALAFISCVAMVCITFIGCEKIKMAHEERMLKAGFKQDIGGWR